MRAVLVLFLFPLFPVVATPLAKALKAVAEKCEVDLRYASISNCPNGEDSAVDTILENDGPAKSLPALADAFAAKNEKLSAVAISYLYKVKDRLQDILKNPNLVSDKTVDTFIRALAQNKGYISSYAAQIVTVLATLKKKDAALFKVLDSHPENVTRNEGYRWAMYQGRLRVFDRIKKAARDRKREYLAHAAYNAPEYMYDYTDAEKKAICEWQKKNLELPEPEYVGLAARTLVLRCLGNYIDIVLSKAEELHKAGQLDSHPIREALTNFTFTCQEYWGNPPTGTPEQCARRAALVGS